MATDAKMGTGSGDLVDGGALEGGVRKRLGGRSARVREAVLQATLQALGELGPEGLSFSEIGRRSGVHATSIQRRWGTRENVILDALLDASQVRISIPNTGTLRGDLLGLAKSVASYVTSPLGEGVVRMMAASQDDPALATSRAEFYWVRFDSARVVIDRAVGRGELPPATPAKLILELLSGPLYFRLLMTREPVDDEFLEQVVDLLLGGLVEPR